MATCILEPKPVVKIEHKLKKFVRKLKEQIKSTHCIIRYDTNVSKWAILDKHFQPIRHFDYGVMVNVNFRPQRVSRPSVGCGSGLRHDIIGIAEGDLRENYYGNDAVGFSYMSFEDGNFINADTRQIIKSANVLRLMSERRALYK